MAHQAHNICWDALASNLRYYSPIITGDSRDNRNLHFRRKPHQAKELGYFAESFARNVEEHTQTERRKYPASYEPPDPDDIIIDDDVAKKITPTVFRWRMETLVFPVKTSTNPACVKRLCQHTDGFECGCPLPMVERRASSFLRKDPLDHEHCNCYPRSSWTKLLNLELVKTLLLYGEIDPISRVCSHPDCDYRLWRERKEYLRSEPEAGWDRVYIHALNSYICLNILFYFPELWDPAMMKGPEEWRDYRCTAMYQRMLHACTHKHILSQTATYPHRQFFGVGYEQFCSEATDWGGKLSFEHFLWIDSSDKLFRSTPFMPNILDIYNVEETLQAKGLPIQLVQQVLEITEYNAPKRRLKVAHHPFHHDNREELQKYLQYCWQILVWCNMMAKAQQIEIDWKYAVASCLNMCFSSPGGERVWVS